MYKSKNFVYFMLLMLPILLLMGSLPLEAAKFSEVPNVLWQFSHSDFNGYHIIFNYNCFDQTTPGFDLTGTDGASGVIGWGGPGPKKNYMYYDYSIVSSDEGQWKVNVNNQWFWWRVNVWPNGNYHANWGDNGHFDPSNFGTMPMAYFGYRPHYDGNYCCEPWNTKGGATVYHQHIAFMPFPISNDQCQVTYEPINGDKYTVRINDFRRWMTTLNYLSPQMRSQPLGSWIIPGSHDACTGYIDNNDSGWYTSGTSWQMRTFASWEQVAALGQAQELDLYDQLHAGS